MLNDATGAMSVDQQLGAYHALAHRYAQAGQPERLRLAPALTESPFAKTIQSALNTFTRAAWAGADAVPPRPQQRALDAFDGLSATDQAIVASLQVGIPDGKRTASVTDYRARLNQDLEDVQVASNSPRDTITLSPEAQARLSGAAEPEAPLAVDAIPEMAAGLNAYAKATR